MGNIQRWETLKISDWGANTSLGFKAGVVVPLRHPGEHTRRGGGTGWGWEAGMGRWEGCRLGEDCGIFLRGGPGGRGKPSGLWRKSSCSTEGSVGAGSCRARVSGSKCTQEAIALHLGTDSAPVSLRLQGFTRFFPGGLGKPSLPCGPSFLFLMRILKLQVGKEMGTGDSAGQHQA